ncbi:chaperonin 10-like protein [Chaetomium strumarium]|uniref:Chaperonin 10-like protein n=1 Tax=Chaetomium strumarium TaxID=1170767 RepID=A0AAJ0H117_9PEZI|nr:chaperonin 10-like protein [Chaetomium strumarium]
MTMAQAPRKQRALKVVRANELAVVDDADIPQVGPDEVLVRVVFVATNPVDAKSADFSPTPGATVGSDFAGDVVAVGAAVEKQLRVGDRVCGLAFGNNPLRPDNGAFAEYVAAPGDLVFNIPPGMDLDQAATLPCGLATVGFALYRHLGLPLPDPPATESEAGAKPQYILIYGGGTATGTLLIQMALRSGLVPVTTCSPKRFERVKALGAAEAFDYRSPTVGADIRAYTNDALDMAVDCITTTASMAVCYGAIGRGGGKYVSLDPFPLRTHTRRSVRPSWVLALTMFGTPIAWKRPFTTEAKPAERAFAEKWFSIAQEMLDRGEIQPHSHEPGRPVNQRWLTNLPGQYAWSADHSTLETTSIHCCVKLIVLIRAFVSVSVLMDAIMIDWY